MIGTFDQDVKYSELEYLLLDDLYEMLETPFDEETRQSVLSITTFLLAMDREGIAHEVDKEFSLAGRRESRSAELGRCHDGLYAHLFDLEAELLADCCSRSTVEATRDAVLVWIHRLHQYQRRTMQRSGAGSETGSRDLGQSDNASRADFVTVFEHKPGRYY
jgi:hypothetical protein